MSKGIRSPVSRVLISFCFYSSVSLTKPQIHERLFNYPNEIHEALEVVLPMFVLFRCWCVMIVLLIKQVQSEFYTYLSVHRTGNCPALFDNPARSYRTITRNHNYHQPVWELFCLASLLHQAAVSPSFVLSCCIVWVLMALM